MWGELWCMILRIDWKGKIGYGDVVSPICYAHAMAQKNCCDVELKFHWPHKKGEKYKIEDPESLDYRTRYLASIVNPINYHQVKINHKFESKLDYNHSNYDDSDSFHNFWYSRVQNLENSKSFIALNTTATHKQQLEEYGGKSKTWKDPAGLEKWQILEEQITSKWGLDVKRVGYETPIADVIDIYRKCLLAIGYHGSTMWVARYLRCPMIIYSMRKQTAKSFQWATVSNKLEVKELINKNPYELRERSLKRLGELNVQFEQYLNIPNIHRLRGKRT